MAWKFRIGHQPVWKTICDTIFFPKENMVGTPLSKDGGGDAICSNNELLSVSEMFVILVAWLAWAAFQGRGMQSSCTLCKSFYTGSEHWSIQLPQKGNGSPGFQTGLGTFSSPLWACQGLNLGTSPCKACTQPLSCQPSQKQEKKPT